MTGLSVDPLGYFFAVEGDPAPPPPPRVPPVVWVVVAVQTRAVVVADRRNVPAVQQLGGVGRSGIFAAALSPAESVESLATEVVAVCAARSEAESAVDAHRGRFAGQFEYKVSECRVGPLEDGPAVQLAARAASCIKCGTDVWDGTVWCQPCRKAMFEGQKRVDPGDPEPARRNTFTPPQDRAGRGSGM